MVRIALISDIHFGKDGRGDFSLPNNKYNDVCIGQLNAEKNMGNDLIAILKEEKPEYLFIAGDLTSIGSPAEYFYCEKKLLDIADKSNIKREKIIWCVGNHDNDWNISKLSDNYGNEARGDAYDEEIEKISIGKYTKIAANVVVSNLDNLPLPKESGIFPASGLYQDEKLIVFILNSCSKCMHNMEFDHGEITIEQLNWFEENLKKYNDDKRWKIVLLHHHPFNYSYPEIGIDTSMLSDGSQFQEIAGKGGVHLILHGHRHHPRCKTQNETSWKNPMSFICAGSLSVCEKERLNGTIPNMFHIIDLEENDNIGQLYLYSFEYLPGSGWERSSKRGGVVPIDAVMRLGKIKTEDEMKLAIEELTNSTDSVLSFDWEELNDDLKFNPCEEVNALIEKTLSDRFDVKAKLPENLTLKRKENK